MKEIDDVEKRRIIECYIAAYNAFDVEGMLTYVHQDIEFKDFSENEMHTSIKGIDDLRQLAEQSKALFTSRSQTITSFESWDDSASVKIRFEATLAVDFPNDMKAGDVLRLNGRSKFKFKEGKLYQIEDYS